MTGKQKEGKIQGRGGKVAVDLSCRIGSITINPCIMNAPGVGSLTPMELAALSSSRAGAVVTPPIVRQAGPELSSPQWSEFEGSSLISPGAGTIHQGEAASLLAHARQGGKPVMACVSASVADDFPENAHHVVSHGADLVLLDLSCRATPDSRILGYNLRLAERVMAEVRARVSCPLGARLPIYLDTLNVEALAGAATRAGMDFLVAVAPAAAALGMDARGQPILRARGGVGELAGAAIKPMALANVRVLYQATGGRLPIIGAGGVASGQDAMEFLLAGACAVQAGTALRRHGPGLFARLETSLARRLRGLGFISAATAVGQLQGPPATERSSQG